MAFACDQAFQGYYDADSPAVDAIASSIAIMPTYGAIGLCGALVLPADVYWKVKRSEDAFGAHASDPLCSYPSQVVAEGV